MWISKPKLFTLYSVSNTVEYDNQTDYTKITHSEIEAIVQKTML